MGLIDNCVFEAINSPVVVTGVALHLADEEAGTSTEYSVAEMQSSRASSLPHDRCLLPEIAASLTPHQKTTHKKIPIAYPADGDQGREFNAFASNLAGT